ncbi:MAG: YigZ family protein [Bacteroidota bacterium]|nr:YigZ family protein [Bacteroidota bacterium]
MDEIYSSVQALTTVQIKIEGSRFIADVFPVLTEEDAKEKLDTIRKKYFDATHHCFAYVIGVEKKIVRYSDDGEPSGTAGVKIHSSLQAKNLSDVLLVVTRYFGGTKLGVGGLGRAYFESAENVIDQATIISKALIQEMQIAFPFAETNPVMNIIHSHKLKIAATNYSDERSILTLYILPSQSTSVRDLFVNATRGSSEISFGEKKTVNWQ